MNRLVWNSKAGFTFLEVLVASSLLLLGVLASAHLTTLNLNASRSFDRLSESAALGSMIMQNLRFEASCRKSLGADSGLNQIINVKQLKQKSGASGWEFRIRVPNINAGPKMDLDILSSQPDENLLPERLLRVGSLRMSDARVIDATETTVRFVVNAYLNVQPLDKSVQQHPLFLGSTILKMNADTGELVSCQAIQSEEYENRCEDMGCSYDPSKEQPCRCARSQTVCVAPGYYPVGFNELGQADCRKFGGSCPENHYLTSVAVGKIACAPIPTPTPNPSATPTPTPSPTPSPSPSPTATPALITETMARDYDGEASGGVPMCQRFNLLNWFCNGYSTCSISSVQYSTNSPSVCNVTAEVTHNDYSGHVRSPIGPTGF